MVLDRTPPRARPPPGGRPARPQWGADANAAPRRSVPTKKPIPVEQRPPWVGPDVASSSDNESSNSNS
eukprot:5185712-Pyramimonas_sp.AAC.1